MLKAVLGAVALLTSVTSLANAQQWGAGAPAASRVEASADPRRNPAASERDSARARAIDAVITEGHIAGLRSALKLTPAQQPYWAPVQAALTELARQQARGEAASLTYRFSDRSAAVAATLMQLRRLRAVATPLIASLDDNQKRDAITFARNMGFQQLVAAF